MLDSDGNTTMHYLATNWQDLLRDAVRGGGACNRKNANGATPLHFAAAQNAAGPGRASILPLLRCGADPNLQDARGATPVHAIYRSVKQTIGNRPNRIEIENPRQCRKQVGEGGSRYPHFRLCFGHRPPSQAAAGWTYFGRFLRLAQSLT